MYIAGSDQIWNPYGGTGLDPAFYLCFGDSNTRRISYAASFGIDHIEEQFRDNISSYLSKIDDISVREKTGCRIIEELLSKKVTNVLDPVFLITKECWEEYIRDTNIDVDFGDYILVYDFFRIINK